MLTGLAFYLGNARWAFSSDRLWPAKKYSSKDGLMPNPNDYKSPGLWNVLPAVTTPLASIFGSGFLVIVPILVGAVGPFSPIAMLVICALAFAVGSIIRFNIKHAEPALAGTPGEATLSFERGSDLALILAYVISVCLYIRILSSFVLSGLDVGAPIASEILASLVIATITVIGMTKGLKVLEKLERWALYVTLLIIVLIFIGFAHYGWLEWSAETLRLPAMPEKTNWEILTIVGGTLIVVQGFETPRYLGDTYDTQTRISASRWSQYISTGVYVVFMILALPLAAALNGQFDDNSLLTMVGLATGLLVLPLIAAAALSQFSAAVADIIAATGNMEEVTHNHLKVKWGYAIVGVGAIVLTWSADTFQIVALASRAFAFYYMLQCFVAISVSESRAQRTGMAVIAAILAFIAAFSVPAG